MRLERIMGILVAFILTLAILVPDTPVSFAAESEDISQTEELSLSPEDTEMDQGDQYQMREAAAASPSEDGVVVYNPQVVVPESSLFSGSASYTIPIEAPPGRGGIQPRISLNYNSFMKNGIIGVGWNLDLGSIQRSTKHGLAYDKDDYVASINGALIDLVRKGSSNFYKPVIEGAFYRFYMNPETNGWEVTTKEGVVYSYGTDDSSRQTNDLGVFKWHMDGVVDTQGNSMTVEYLSSGGVKHPRQIVYGAGGNSIGFSYEDVRNDVVPLYTSGSPVSTRLRLKTITVEAGGDDVRQYKLAYRYSNTTGRSLLESVTECGTNGTTCLPATELTWTEGPVKPFENRNIPLSPGVDLSSYSELSPLMSGDVDGDGATEIVVLGKRGDRFDVLASRNGIMSNLGSVDFDIGLENNHHIHMADMNGDNLTDIVVNRYEGDGRYSINVCINDNSTFSVRQKWFTTNEIGLKPYGSYTYIYLNYGDMNGDGKPDLEVTSDNPFREERGTSSLYLNVFPNGQSEERFETLSAYDYDYQKHTDAFADVNNDGLEDLIIRKEGSWDVHQVSLSTGTGMRSPAGWVRRSFEEKYAWMPIADVNEDGLKDLLIEDSSGSQKIYAFLSTGGAFRERYVAHRTSPYAEDDDRHSGLNMAELTGDGTPDPWYEDNAGNVHVWPSTSEMWSDDPSSKDDSVWGARDRGSYTEQNRLVPADIDGNGIHELVYKNGSTLRMVKASTTDHADLLHTIKTSTGAVFTIDYVSSARGAPGKLPYVVQTVSSIKVDDGVSTYTTGYTYSGGLHDYADREFRGFATTTRTLPDGTVVESTFLQSDTKKGMLLQQITKDRDGRIFSVLKNGYNERLIDGYRQPVYFPYVEKRHEYACDGSISDLADLGQCLHVRTDFDYDDYGNVIYKASFGDTSTTKDDRHEYTEYNYDLNDWIVSLPKTTYTKASPAETAPRLQQTRYEYRPDTNLLISKTYCLDVSDCRDATDGPTVSYDYDDHGNLVATYDPKGNPPAMMQYDEQTNTYPWIQTNPAGHGTETLYDYRFGKPRSIKDPNGNETKYVHDVLGRPKKVTKPYDGSSPYGTVSYEYPDLGDPVNQRIETYATAVGGASGSFILKKAYFDGLGRVTRTAIQGPEGKEILTDAKYNSRGLVEEKSLPYFNGEQPAGSTKFEYDCLGRITKTTNPDGTAVTATYDKGWTNIIDANGHKKSERRSAFGNLMQVVQYEGQEGIGNFTVYARTSFEYDALGNLTGINDPTKPNAKVTQIFYDALSRRTDMTDPNTGTWSYQYDNNGNLTCQIHERDPIDTEIRYEYDEVNRITKKRRRALNPVLVSYIHDDPAVPNSQGKLSSVVDPSGSTSYKYDKRGRLQEVIRAIDGSAPRSTKTAYDSMDRVTRITYPDNPDSEVVANTYDAGALSQVSSGSTVHAAYSDFTPSGQAGNAVYGNGVATAHGYYPRTNRLNTVITVGPTGELQNLKYEYDKGGNINWIRNRMNCGLSEHMTYDAMDRLTLWERKCGDGTPQEPPNFFDYFENGNIKLNSRVDPASEYSYDPQHPYAVTGTLASPNRYDYDPKGNMIERNGASLAHDREGRLTEILAGDPPSTIASFVYDFEGKRVKKTSGPSTTLYYGDLYECTDGSCTKHIFAGGQRIAWKDSTGVYYYHGDHLGSLDRATRSDGSVAETDRYYPYGELRSHSGAKDFDHKFTGKPFDAEIGLYYYGARYYDPAIGRFITADPIIQSAFDPPTFPRLVGHAYLPSDPPVYSLGGKGGAVSPSGATADQSGASVDSLKLWHNLNTYTYVENNPLNSVDPLGLSPVDDYFIQPTAWWLYTLNNFAANVFALPDRFLDLATQTTADERMAWAAQFPGGLDDALLGATGVLGKLPNLATKGLEPYQVGTFAELQKLSTVGDDLALHHAGQAHAMKQVVSGFTRSGGVSIAIQTAEHAAIPTIKGLYQGSARSLLAEDIWKLRSYTDAPNTSLQELIQLNKELFPGSFVK